MSTAGSPLDRSPVIPVVQLPEGVDPVAAGVEIARALSSGGIRVIEVTLRTTGAEESIRAIREDVPDVLVGAGSVLDAAGLDSALGAGAQFVVTPGTSRALLGALVDCPVPVVPGAGTVSEVLDLMAAGFDEVKLFPVESLGGPAFVRALLAPLRDLRVCPTGGVTAASAPAYLALDQVPCVGGSWLTPADVVRREDWAAVTALARAVSPEAWSVASVP